MRRASLVSMILLGALALIQPPPLAAQSGLEPVADALRRDPVYVDPEASEVLPADAADRLGQKIRESGEPLFVAVLPASAADEAGGGPEDVLSALGPQVGLAGTYAVVVGESFRAASNVMPAGRAGALATASIQARRADGVEAVLAEFVDRVAEAGSSGEPAGDDGRGSGDGSSGTLGLLALFGLAAGGVYLWLRGRSRHDEELRRELEGERQMLLAEASVLGEDVLALEPDVALHPEARNDYEAGVSRYRSARAALDYADDRIDLVRVGRVVDEGRYAMNRARARVEGREPPPPPSELRVPGRHDEPALDLDERGQPTYIGYGAPFYGGGWFGGGGGLLTGLFLGQMLGGGWGGWGYDPHHGDGGDGDFGGGDFGGGDFGGGDFGGGDFGGGDFG